MLIFAENKQKFTPYHLIFHFQVIKLSKENTYFYETMY